MSVYFSSFSWSGVPVNSLGGDEPINAINNDIWTFACLCFNPRTYNLTYTPTKVQWWKGDGGCLWNPLAEFSFCWDTAKFRIYIDKIALSMCCKMIPSLFAMTSFDLKCRLTHHLGSAILVLTVVLKSQGIAKINAKSRWPSLDQMRSLAKIRLHRSSAELCNKSSKTEIKQI